MIEAMYKALLIGVGEYRADPQNLLRLRGPLHDLPALHGALSHPETGLVADAEIETLTNPTKAQAEKAIHDFFRSGSREDVLVFYFSGHGRITLSGKLFLCVTDSIASEISITGIAATTLRDCMEESGADRLVVILDCCHSGAFRDEPDFKTALAGHGTFFLASSRASQLAHDGNGRGPSPFTAALVSALKDPASDADRDGFITFDDLYRVVYDRLSPSKQFPQRSQGEGTVALAKSGMQAGPPMAKPPGQRARSAVILPHAPTPPVSIISSRLRVRTPWIVAIIVVFVLGALGIYSADSRKPGLKSGGNHGATSNKLPRPDCSERIFLEWGPQMRCGDEAPVWSYDPAGKRCLEPLFEVEMLRGEIELLRSAGASGFGNLPVGFQLIRYSHGSGIKVLDSEGKELPRTNLFVSYRMGSAERDGGMRINDERPIFLSRAGYWCDENSKVITPAAHKP